MTRPTRRRLFHAEAIAPWAALLVHAAHLVGGCEDARLGAAGPSIAAHVVRQARRSGQCRRSKPSMLPQQGPRLKPANAGPTISANTMISASDLASLRSRSLLIPVRGIATDDLASSFHDARGSRRHEAIDILAPRGTDVLAVEDGKVAKMFTSDAGGLTLYQFDPSETFVYYYAHLDRIRAGSQGGCDAAEGRCDWNGGHDRKRAEGHAPPALCDLEARSRSPMVGRDRARSVSGLARSLRKLALTFSAKQ